MQGAEGTEPMTFENYVKGQLAAFAVSEGYRYGGTANMVAAAQVIGNRVRAGWFGGDWLLVIAHAPEVAGTVDVSSGPVNPRDGGFRALLGRVDDIYYGTADDALTEGALYYAELCSAREWFVTNIATQPDSHPRLAQVGPVTFFG